MKDDEDDEDDDRQSVPRIAGLAAPFRSVPFVRLQLILRSLGMHRVPKRPHGPFCFTIKLKGLNSTTHLPITICSVRGHTYKTPAKFSDFWTHLAANSRNLPN